MNSIQLLAANQGFTDFADAFKNLFNQIWVPVISIASALAVIWGLYLGFKFWTAAGDETKKKSAKSALISFVVGIVVIFAVAVGAPLLIVALGNWKDDQSKILPILSIIKNVWMLI